MGVSADVAGALALLLLTLPALAAVGAFLVGLWPVTIALILLASLSVNAFLAYRLLAAGRRIARVRGDVEDAVDQISPQLRNVSPPTSPLSARGWLANRADPSGLTAVTDPELDGALTRVEAVARDVLGEDAVVEFTVFYISLALGIASLQFLGHSRIGERSGRFLVSGPASPPSVSQMTRQAETAIGKLPARPWHLDHGWRDLVRRVWAKERPFTGDFFLNYDAALGWYVAITPIREGMAEPTLTYRLHGDDLVPGPA